MDGFRAQHERGRVGRGSCQAESGLLNACPLIHAISLAQVVAQIQVVSFGHFLLAKKLIEAEMKPRSYHEIDGDVWCL